MKSALSWTAIITLGLGLQAITGSQAAATVSGELGLGVMVIDSANNLNPSSSKKTITSLDEAGEKEVSTIALLLPELEYQLEGTGYGLFFSTRPPVEEAGEFTMAAGLKYTGWNPMEIRVGAFVSPFQEVWKDPYLVGSPRSETDQLTVGGFVSMRNIGGTGLQLQLAYLKTDVDDDVSGELLPELARDGDIYGVALGYRYDFNSTLSLTPKIRYVRGDLDGESEAFDRYGVELQLRYRQQQLMVMPALSLVTTRYDEEHPLFADSRDEDSYSLRCIIEYLEPLGYRNFSVRAILGYSEGISDIDFFETESLFGGGAVVYRF